MKGKKDMRQVDIERLIFVVQGITYIHTLSLRTYAAAIVLKMAKVEKTAQSAIHAICHAKDPSNDTHHASQSPRSQPPLSKTRHNKVIRESDNTVQRVSACFVVLVYVVLTQMASQTPLLHVE